MSILKISLVGNLPMRQLTRDEARQIANTIAKLPDLLVQTDRLQAEAALDTPVPSPIPDKSACRVPITLVSAVTLYFFTVGGLRRRHIGRPLRARFYRTFGLHGRHAERIIKKLHRKNGYDDPALIMRVKEEDHRTVLFLPLIPSD